MQKVALYLVLATSILMCAGQNLNQVTVDVSHNGMMLTDFLTEMENEYDFNILYNRGSIEGYTISGVRERHRLLDFLDIFIPSFQSLKLNSQVLVIMNKTDAAALSSLKYNHFIINSSEATGNLLTGRIIDGATDEGMIGAYIYVPEVEKGSITDINGQFQMTLPTRDWYIAEVTSTGYEKRTILVAFSNLRAESSSLSLVLYPSSTELESVVISGERQDENISQAVTGVETMNIESIKSLPTFLGEVDPLKSLSALPGVSSSGDVTAGLNVRGGDIGQNLIFQDGAIIYSPSHMFGFFSAFNPDMLSGVSLYKGGGSAEFGGRVSSVMDVSLRNGDLYKHYVKGSAGLISSRLLVEGPLSKGRSSYNIGGRYSYPNWLIKRYEDVQMQNSSAQFYDITSKIYHEIDDKNLISVSGYYSYDDFNLASDSTFSWTTKNVSLKWNHIFNENLLSSLTLANSNYGSRVLNKETISTSRYQSGINTLSAKYEVNLSHKGNEYRAGANISYSVINPGEEAPLTEESITNEMQLYKQKTLEPSFFLQGDFNLTESLKLSAGARLSTYWRFGTDLIYQYDPDSVVYRTPQVVDSTYYGSGDLVSFYSGFEPRISLRYLINTSTSIKASYYRTYQYLHLISNTTIPTPQDYWLGSSENLKPQIGNQFSLGVFKNVDGSKYEISLESYYKITQNVVDYIEGTDLTLNQAIENSLLQGDGLAYGLEVLLKKNGKFNGWISYTYSRSLKKFAQDNERLLINDGDYYPSIYDQPHNLSVILNYQFNERTSLSTNFQYSTGRPITIPTSKYSYGPYLAVLNYSDRNAYRMPDYHRLDLSLTLRGRNFEEKWITGDWIFSIYNVYARKNPYSVYFNPTGFAYKLSILGSFIPSITYNFKL